MTTNDRLWQTKLAARLHDPAEKALVLLRDPAGHENGTSRALARLLGYHELPDTIDPDNDEALIQVLKERAGFFGRQMPAEMYRHIQRADWWAAAADRPQWPMEEITVKTKTGEEKTLIVAGWAQVRWTERPQLIHPLTGGVADLGKLADVDIAQAKQSAFDHFSGLLVTLGAKDAQMTDWRAVLLAFWRFGPELPTEADHGKFGPLWSLLPADTRVPDHSIWEHLDLTSAFAGAFAADPNGEAALLALSIGPVQPFIAAARKLDDLWAGSHLLSRLAWETMRPVAETLGPDAILFPRLRGIAQVDLWLREMGLPDALFEGCEWKRSATDANPLFAAALPNRFVAVMPASRARELAEQCRDAAREWIQAQGQAVVKRLLAEAGLNADDQSCPAYAQMREQLAGFPEVHWAAVPFSLICCRDAEKQRDLDLSGLLQAMAPFFGVEPGKPCGFLDAPAWKVLAQELQAEIEGRPLRFYAPNPGVLYPAVYDLAERVLAAAKSARVFAQSPQHGWRDSLSGEAEWLTHDRNHLSSRPGKRAAKRTLWTLISERRPAWAREGEHLSGLSALKRLWPTLFAEEVAAALDTQDVGRFTVSTHTMALAGQLEALQKALVQKPDAERDRRWSQGGGKVPALPRKLAHLRNSLAGRFLAQYDQCSDAGNDTEIERLRREFKALLGVNPETYYGLLLMDGDRMGAILSGEDANVPVASSDCPEGDDRSRRSTAITYRCSFHEQVRVGFDRLAQSNEALRAYGGQRRAVSPNRHLAISSALNDFSQHVARHVVEKEHLGRLIYSGGDDVMAVLAVRDLIACAERLRHAYSGTMPDDEKKDWGDLRRDRQHLHCKAGFAWLDGRLMRMMGKNATASAGLVVAHHQAPLSMVLRELRAAEKRAKEQGGRDAVSLALIKRSGGQINLTLEWHDLPLFERVANFLRREETSRRAVYNSLEWLKDLPPLEEKNRETLESLLAYQLARQSKGAADAEDLAHDLTAHALRHGARAREQLEAVLTAAEFLAREVRQGDLEATPEPTTTEAAA